MNRKNALKGLLSMLVAVLVLSGVMLPQNALAQETDNTNPKQKEEYIYVNNQSELDKLIAEYNSIASKHGGAINSDTRIIFDDNIKNTPMLSPRAFEEQLVEEEIAAASEELLGETTPVTDSKPGLLKASTSKTYKKTDKMPILGFLYKYTMYAKVTRNSGKVTKVSQWAEQSGLSYPIKLSTTKTWYTLNSSKKNGTAYFRVKKQKYIVPNLPNFSYESFSTQSLKF
ncbi:hypothetical protein ARP01_04210 [Listeria monocytogenes]|uniref:hypothetical protein n=1 Tax=Listeria monocytogenes TaxID=1639 RepID=UPI000874CB73|nr:hypothetical protein [Listeria monocytogenes]EAC3496424.1 hypothetical protein [Listeria monocytogenes]EAC7381729.1 hypothetical protein [Listeria monocytogenes]EAC7384646.1 hypothetical protein [Listeria monocytogenes]EAC7387593.1 hypothetical protein [Listeria monocytogenes]EAC7390702.1 hypothetical protein [Listeria monocytogenes]